MRLNHRQLEAFRAVMTAGTVTGAADILCVSQPAVSRLISDLEYAVGLSLFQREKGRLIPTREAEILYDEVEKSFISVEQIGRVAEELKEYRIGELRIAAMPALALTILPELITRFRGNRSGIEITLQIRSSTKVMEWIANQHFDVGFTGMPTVNPAIETHSLMDAQLVCVMPNGHRLADAQAIEPGDLRNEAFVSLGSDQRLRHNVDEVFEKARIPRQMAFDTQLSHAACAFVAQGVAVSLVDPVTALHFARQGLLVARPFFPSIRFDTEIIYPAMRPKSQMTQAFVELVRKEIEKMTAESGSLFRMDPP